MRNLRPGPKEKRRQIAKASDEDSFDAQIRAAIAGKRLLELRYHGGLRVVEPHDYGVQKGSVRLLGYQIRSPASAGGKSSIGWRLFEVAKIETLSILPQTFRGSRGQWHDDHLAWDDLYARVG